MNVRQPCRLSDEERAARAARMRAHNADPAFIAKRKRNGKAGWTEETRLAAAERLAALRADPGFVARQRAARERAKPPRLALPEHTAPVVRGLFVEMAEQLATLGDVSSRSGVAYDTLRSWRNCMPHVDLLEAALNTLDLELAIVPIGTRDRNGFVRKKTRERIGGHP